MSWLRTKLNLLRQCVMLAQNISVCGNLFAIFWRRFYFTRVEKLLSSRELITAARVVQKGGHWASAVGCWPASGQQMSIERAGPVLRFLMSSWLVAQHFGAVGQRPMTNDQGRV
jgi:hypothetical protein